MAFTRPEISEGALDSQRLTPLGAGERIELIDVVRGFALYGVLLANLVWASQEVAVTSAQVSALPTGVLDRLTRYAVYVLIDGKFYTLFAFLFGLGFAVQLARGDAKGIPILAMYRRRLGILLLIGLAHAYLLWYGDVLHHYAILGFLLILFRRWSDRAFIILGLVSGIVVPAAVAIARALITSDAGGSSAPDPTELHLIQARFRAFTEGSITEALWENAKFAATYWTAGIALHALPANLGRFLLGLYAGRHRLLQEPGTHLPFFRKSLKWGLVFGLFGNGLWVLTIALTHSGTLAKTSSWVLAAQLPIYAGHVAMAAFYLAAIVLLSQRPAWRRRLSHLGPVGRMALTNYLTQSLIYLLLFYGFGLALLGRVGATFCLALSVVIFFGQILFSSWWLHRFRFGPAEWLWRSLTYGSRQPMRIPISGLST